MCLNCHTIIKIGIFICFREIQNLCKDANTEKQCNFKGYYDARYILTLFAPYSTDEISFIHVKTLTYLQTLSQMCAYRITTRASKSAIYPICS